MTDLELISTDEILHELAERHKTFVYAGVKKGARVEEGSSLLHMGCVGDPVSALGLLELASQDVSQAVIGGLTGGDMDPRG